MWLGNAFGNYCHSFHLSAAPLAVRKQEVVSMARCSREQEVKPGDTSDTRNPNASAVPQKNSGAGGQIVQHTIQAHVFTQMTRFSHLQALREGSAVPLLPLEKGKGNGTEEKSKCTAARCEINC